MNPTRRAILRVQAQEELDRRNAQLPIENVKAPLFSSAVVEEKSAPEAVLEESPVLEEKEIEAVVLPNVVEESKDDLSSKEEVQSVEAVPVEDVIEETSEVEVKKKKKKK